MYWINVRSDAKWTNEVNSDLVKMAKRYSNFILSIGMLLRRDTIIGLQRIKPIDN